MKKWMMIAALMAVVGGASAMTMPNVSTAQVTLGCDCGAPGC